MADQDHPAHVSGSGVHVNYLPFGSYGVAVAQTRHVPARTSALLHVGYMGTVRRMGGNGRGSLRKRRGGHTENQQSMKGSFQELSVHREFSFPNHGYKDDKWWQKFRVLKSFPGWGWVS
jgi:hypothetical protein